MTDIQQQVPEQDDALVGHIFEGRFEIISLLGRGGMGMVYKARHIHMDKTVAIKILTPGAMADEKSFLRFEQEARAYSSLEHRNIVAIYDFGRSVYQTGYLVMEFVNGKNLEDVIVEQSEFMGLERFKRIFTQVCDGMQHAHKKGVIHRDLKPSNIMIFESDDEKDLVKILDFGLAKLSNPEQSQQHLTKTGMVMGSPPFMSPEQCRGEDLDDRSDVYSLGCVMYAALTGQVPLIGNNSMATIYMHTSDLPSPVTQMAPWLNIPAALEQVVMCTLEKNRNLRPQSMAELGQFVADAINGKEVVLPNAVKSTAQPQDSQNNGGIAVTGGGRELPSGEVSISKSAKSAFGQMEQSPPSPRTSSKTPWLFVVVSAVCLGFGAWIWFFPHQIHRQHDHFHQTTPSTPSDSAAQNAGSPTKGSASPVKSQPPQASVQKAPEPSAYSVQQDRIEKNNSAKEATSKSEKDVVAAANTTPNVATLKTESLSDKKLRALKLANEYKVEARKAYEHGNTAQANRFLEQCLANEIVVYGKDDPHLLPTLARIVAASNGQIDSATHSRLELALKIFSNERKECIEAVNKSDNPMITWRSLANVCLELSKQSRKDAERTYMQWSLVFLDLAVSSWNYEKNDDYYKMLRTYFKVANYCGDLQKAQEIKNELMLAGQPPLEPHDLKGGPGVLRGARNRFSKAPFFNKMRQRFEPR